VKLNFEDILIFKKIGEFFKHKIWFWFEIIFFSEQTYHDLFFVMHTKLESLIKNPLWGCLLYCLMLETRGINFLWAHVRHNKKCEHNRSADLMFLGYKQTLNNKNILVLGNYYQNYQN